MSHQVLKPILSHKSVQIRAGPAEERGRVCRFNEPSDEVAFLNLRTSDFFWVGSSTVWGFFCPKLRFWNYFFSDCLEHKKLFDSKLHCSDLEVVPFRASSCSKLRFWNYFFQVAWNTKKAFRFKAALLWVGSSGILAPYHVTDTGHLYFNNTRDKA